MRLNRGKHLSDRLQFSAARNRCRDDRTSRAIILRNRAAAIAFAEQAILLRVDVGRSTAVAGKKREALVKQVISRFAAWPDSAFYRFTQLTHTRYIG
jgi:hypothetical protein